MILEVHPHIHPEEPADRRHLEYPSKGKDEIHLRDLAHQLEESGTGTLLPALRVLQRAVSHTVREYDIDYWTGAVYTTNRRVWEHDERFKQTLRETRAMAIDSLKEIRDDRSSVKHLRFE